MDGLGGETAGCVGIQGVRVRGFSRVSLFGWRCYVVVLSGVTKS